MLSTSAAASAGRRPAARPSPSPLTLPAVPRAARHHRPPAALSGTRSWAATTVTGRHRLSPPPCGRASSRPQSSRVAPPLRLSEAATPGPGRAPSPWSRMPASATARPSRSALRRCPRGAAPTPWAPRPRASPLRVGRRSGPSVRGDRSAPVRGGAGSWAGQSSSSSSSWLSSRRGSPGCGTTSPPSSTASMPCPGRQTLPARPGSSWDRMHVGAPFRTRPRGRVPTPSCCCTRRTTGRRA